MLADNIIEIAKDHGLVIPALYVENGEIIVAEKNEFVACVEDIMASYPRNEFNNPHDTRGLF